MFRLVKRVEKVLNEFYKSLIEKFWDNKEY